MISRVVPYVLKRNSIFLYFTSLSLPFFDVSSKSSSQSTILLVILLSTIYVRVIYIRVNQSWKTRFFWFWFWFLSLLAETVFKNQHISLCHTTSALNNVNFHLFDVSIITTVNLARHRSIYYICVRVNVQSWKTRFFWACSLKPFLKTTLSSSRCWSLEQKQFFLNLTTTTRR